MRIVGIDPGTTRVGYALLDAAGGRVRLLGAETLPIPARSSPAGRLLTLERLLRARLRRDRPDTLAIERLYFSKNAKTALAVAEARGVILLTAERHVRSIGEYTPLEVKLALTGYGRADKEQVRRMVETIFRGADLPPGDDAIDAIAIALAACYLRRDLRTNPEYQNTPKVEHTNAKHVSPGYGVSR